MNGVALRVTGLCEIDDFSDPDIASVLRRLAGPGAGRTSEADPRAWAVAMAARALSQELAAGARVLAVGAGVEGVLALLADRVGEVAAADWGGGWPGGPAGSFDAVVCGPVEGVTSPAAVAAGVAAMARLLKPGGVVSLATRLRLHGPPGGTGWPGRAILLSAAELHRYAVDASGLTLVGDLPEQPSDRTMSARRHLGNLAAGGAAVARDLDRGPVTATGGYVFTMAHMLLRKTKEPGMEQMVPTAAPTPTARSAPGAWPPEGGSWAQQVVRLQQALLSADGLVQRGAHQLNLLSEADYEIGQTLEHLEHARAEASAHLDRAALALAGAGPTAPGAAEAPGGVATPCTVRISEGLEFVVVVDKTSADPITTTFLTGYCLFQDLVSVMLRLVAPGDAVLDIGAHVGTFTFAAAAAGCPVLAIEAAPANVALLLASVAENEFHEVRIVSAAASDEPGSAQFCAIGPWGTVLNRPRSALSIEVPAVTIDELLFQTRFPKPRFVKMDVEGSEIRAMHGMANLLSADDAPALLLESNGHTLGLMGTNPTELLREVEGFGYRAYMVAKDRLVPVQATDLQPCTEVDYLALKAWPPNLDGWDVGGPLTDEERVAMLVEDCRSESEDCRAYIGRAIAGAGPELLAHPDLRAALDRLAEDPVGTVRGAVAWWKQEAEA